MSRFHSLRVSIGIAVAIVPLAILWFVLSACRPTLYFSGIVHTFDARNSVVSAVVTHGDRVRFVGSDGAADAFVKNRYPLPLRLLTRRVDLQGQALMPGFVDAHSHFLATGLTSILPDLSPPASGGSIDSPDALYDFIAREASTTPRGDWIVGFNYDNTAFVSGMHPTRAALDAVTSEHPVFVRHNSGHMGVANTLALKRLAADTDLPDSVRQAVRHRLANFTPTDNSGLLQELAAPPLGWLVLKTPWRHLIKVVSMATEAYASQGYTTVQSGSANAATVTLLKWLTRLGWVPQRVIAWPLHQTASDTLPDTINSRKFLTGAAKLIVDGSPQGYTAHLSQPYHQPLPGTTSKHQGHSLFTAAQLREVITPYLKADRPLAIHTNGDGAIELVLNALESLLPSPGAENARRVILVHAQTMRDDQIERLPALGVTPSYFPGHTWHWGEWHYRQSLGPTRAAFISPMRSTQEAGVRISIHTDAPVTPTNSMQLLWMATQRLTQNNRLLGGAERLTRLQALRAMTIDPAWQNRVDHNRGSIEAGKFADLVWLSEDPLSADDVRTISVVRTIVGGDTIYQMAQ